MPLASFDGIERVKVTAAGSPLYGKTGRVHRQLIRDESAWIRMDDPLPEELRSFPADDSRGNDIMLWPRWCDEIGGDEP